MGRLLAAANLGVDRLDDILFLATLPDGPIVVLEGPAALVWDCAVGAERAEVATNIAALTNSDVDEIAADVEAAIFTLVEVGLLREVD